MRRVTAKPPNTLIEATSTATAPSTVTTGLPCPVRALLSQLTGRAVYESVTVFPPFYSEFGKNPRFGGGVLVNSGRFQDTGVITISDGPVWRADMVPAPVVDGRRVWFGTSVTVV